MADLWGHDSKSEYGLSVFNKGIATVMIVSGKDCFYDQNQFIGTKFLKKRGVSQ